MAEQEQLSSQQKAGQTLARIRRERRKRLQEQREEQERKFWEQVATGELTIRRATGAELDRLRAEAAHYREQHPEYLEQSVKVRADAQRKPQEPEPSQPDPPTDPRPIPKPAHEPRACEHCGHLFTPARRAAYCSDACRVRAYKLRARAAA